MSKRTEKRGPEVEPAESSEELVQLYLQGDEAALGHLLRRHNEDISRYCGTRLGRIARWLRRDDQVVMSAVWRKVYKYAKRFNKENASFTGWLKAVARQACSRHAERELRRRMGQSPEAPEGEDWFSSRPVGDPSAEEIAERRMAVEAAERAIESLPPREREVLLLRLFEQLEWEEMVTRLGRCRGSLQNDFGRGIRALRCLLRGYAPYEHDERKKNEEV